MTTDPSLEELSEKIRRGEPVSYLEAVAAINYQEQLAAERRSNSIFARVKRWPALVIQHIRNGGGR